MRTSWIGILIAVQFLDISSTGGEDISCSGEVCADKNIVAAVNTAAWARGVLSPNSASSFRANDQEDDYIRDPHKLVSCCGSAPDEACRRACLSALRSGSTELSVLDALQVGGCGPPALHDPLWQCMLAASATAPSDSKVTSVGLDAAKLQCCSLANSHSCRRLCWRAHANDWAASWEDLERCVRLPEEHRLANCLQEVDEPCVQGCDSLKFCAGVAISLGPNALFRSCSEVADDAARAEVASWMSEGTVRLPNGELLPLRNGSLRCGPDTWRTLACVLHTRPCRAHAMGVTSRLCGSDCTAVMAECIDWTRIPKGMSVAGVCSLLAGPVRDADPCVSVHPLFHSEAKEDATRRNVTVPCSSRPCREEEVCFPRNPASCPAGRCSIPYSCAPGCRLGEVSSLMMTVGDLVRVPLGPATRGCSRVCHCGENGTLGNCVDLPCYPPAPCWLAEKKIEHRSTLDLHCNVCACQSGELSCGVKPCLSRSPGPSLPCGCAAHHVPVCGADGRTYPNACVAKCGGLQDTEVEFGPCWSSRPCGKVKCASGERCLEDRRVCLTSLQRPCQQHQCVSVYSCARQPSRLVCDTQGRQHRNPCALFRAGADLAYFGSCLTGCRSQGVVCGADGETYGSECAAWARRVPVDYAGPCIAVAGGCAAVECPSLAARNCQGVVPPGACCPVCAGAFKAHLNVKLLGRVLHAQQLATHPSPSLAHQLTLQTLLDAIQRLVQVMECSVRGYLSLDGELVVLLMVAVPPGSAAQRSSCADEANRLSGVLGDSGALVQSHLLLSSLSFASPLHRDLQDAAASALQPNFVLFMATMLTLATAPISHITIFR